jgi:hypothetical protein
MTNGQLDNGVLLEQLLERADAPITVVHDPFDQPGSEYSVYIGGICLQGAPTLREALLLAIDSLPKKDSP